MLNLLIDSGLRFVIKGSVCGCCGNGSKTCAKGSSTSKNVSNGAIGTDAALVMGWTMADCVVVIKGASSGSSGDKPLLTLLRSLFTPTPTNPPMVTSVAVKAAKVPHLFFLRLRYCQISSLSLFSTGAPSR